MFTYQPLVSLEFLSADEFELRLGDEVRTGTLYYLGIDPRTADHNCSRTEGLRRLFSGWIDILQTRDSSQPRYLPFDFSDESTQWLACQMSGNDVDTILGWAPVEGWAVSPSDFREHSESLTEFTPGDAAFVQTFYLPRLLSDLRRLCQQLASLTDADLITDDDS